MTLRLILMVIAIAAGALGAGAIGSGLWLPAKAALARGLIVQAWDRARAGEPAPKPWPWADTHPVAWLRVADLGLDVPIVAGATGPSLAFAPGHLNGTPAPGEIGTSVIAGHRDTNFRALARMSDGMRLTIETASGSQIDYRVVGRTVVDSRLPWQVEETPYRALALVTCYPFDALDPGGPYRFVVHAAEVGAPVEK